MVLSRDFLKTGKTLARLTKKKRERSQIKTINESRDITIASTETQRIIKDYYEQPGANKLDDLGKMENS